MFTVIGAATVDLFVSNLPAMPRSEGGEFAADSPVFLEDPLRCSLGGNGAGSAYALARLGSRVALAGGLGEDHLGDWMTEQLAGAGVDIANVRRFPGIGTATTLFLSDVRQNRIAFHHAGANSAVNGDSVDDELLRQSHTLLLTGYSTMPGLRPDGAVDLFRRARRSGTLTAADIGPAIADPPRVEELRPLLAYTDFFICNEHELNVCAGEKNLAKAMAEIVEGGTGCVVVKQGADGASVLQRGEMEGPTAVPGFSVNAQTKAGAGDSFNAGFLLAIADGAAPVQAARFGNAAAAIVVSTPHRPLDALSRAAVAYFRDSAPRR